MRDETHARGTRAARRRLGGEDDPDEGFLTRWSRRKEAVREGEEGVPEPFAEEQAAALPAEVTKDQPVEEIAPEDLPDIETMDKDSDYKAFMKTGVPPDLQRQALARLWRSDPALANLDELLDYGENFATEGKIVGALKTAYQVGSGYLKQEEDDDPPVAELASDEDGATAPEAVEPETESVGDAGLQVEEEDGDPVDETVEV